MLTFDLGSNLVEREPRLEAMGDGVVSCALCVKHRGEKRLRI